MTKEKVLVIGASGQIGVELTLALRKIYGNANVVASDLREENELFTAQSWLFLLVGQEVRPAGYDPLADTLTAQQVQKTLNDIRGVVAKCATTMPTHEAFIARHCAASVEPTIPAATA